MALATDLASSLMTRIDGAQRGRHVIKIRTLMEMFGYEASFRLRQSSLVEVLRQLSEWGIDHRFSGNPGAGDWISLGRIAPSDVPAPDWDIAPLALPLEARPMNDLLSWLFEPVDVLGPERAADVCQDLVLALWAHRPVVALVDAHDEHFGLFVGLIAAHMRRRRLAFQDVERPIAPTIMTWQDLRGLARGTIEGQFGFPQAGAIYIVRDVAEDSQDDEAVATIREMFVPHTFRLRARFATTRGESQPRAREDADFQKALSWLALYAGAPSLVEDLQAAEFLDLASTFAHAARASDEAQLRAAHDALPVGFKAGYESAEHMTAKALLFDFLQRAYPGEPIDMEVVVDDPLKETLAAARIARPDIRCGKRLFIEFETLRGLGREGGNAILALQRKLQDKARHLGTAEEVWVLFPTDVALLLLQPLAALVAHLQRAAPTAQWRMGCIDWHERRPVLFFTEPVVRAPMRLESASWRPSGKQPQAVRLSWQDVAGYDALRDHLEEAVLDPLRRPEFFAEHGLTAPNGVLLYGLPGCGKSLVGRVLAGELDVACRLIVPSDLTSKWIGEGTERVRALFDDALRLPACLIVIDELDAIAAQRDDVHMHQDERRQVNELLAQLDRIAGRPVTVVATTNYLSGVDVAIRRSGRFDVKVPVFPPDTAARGAIFGHYLRRYGSRMDGILEIDVGALADLTPLFTPADIATVVQMASRSAVRQARDSRPCLVQKDLERGIGLHVRSITRRAAVDWIAEAQQELATGHPELARLEEDVATVFGVER